LLEAFLWIHTVGQKIFNGILERGVPSGVVGILQGLFSEFLAAGLFLGDL